MNIHPSACRRIVAMILLLQAAPLHAASKEPVAVFSDVSATSSLAPAVSHLVSIGAVSAGGRFKPEEKLTRAQAVKILISSTVKPEELAKITTSSFPDIPNDAWFLRFAEAAAMRKMVSPSAPFNPNGTVTKAAFLKMLLLANKIDPVAAFSDIHLPLSSDVPDPSAWYYPQMRYAVASSMTAANSEGLLSPSREITRSDAALLLYRLDQYIAGDRAQVLLSQTEFEIARILSFLDAKDIQQAEYASARSILTARGALTSRPNEPIVQGALRIAKGFESLVLSYKAGRDGKSDDVIRYAKEAYAAADKAEAISKNLSGVTRRMRLIAKNMAEEARKVTPTP